MSQTLPDTPDSTLALGYCSAKVQKLRVKATSVERETLADALAEEVPVALVYNGISHAVMLASPVDLADFGRGFSLSERIISNLNELYDLELMPHNAPHVHGVEIRMEIASAAFAKLKQKRRSMAGRTGCGVCGIESLAALDMDLPQVSSDVQIPLGVILAAERALRQTQVINTATGALHAAAWVSVGGEILLLREDVGRHNALDKLIGALAFANTARAPGFVLLTSRASYELVQKAARANMPLLATVSAPTSLAVNMAKQAGLTLIGFVREHGAVVYAHERRLLSQAS
jgi:FdhD protein